MAMKKLTETALVRQCLDYLHLRGILAWRVNSGAFMGEYKCRKRFVRMNGARGHSDIALILPGGTAAFVEAKMPGKHPTEEQMAFMDRVRSAGGVAFVVRSLEDLQRELEVLEV